MKNLKCLTLETLSYLIEKLNVALTIQESNYHLELEKGKTYTFDVPNYEQGKSVVDIYMNGLKMMEEKHYSISSTGKVSMKNEVYSEGNVLSVVHRKLRW